MKLHLEKTDGLFGMQLQNEIGSTVELNATPAIGGELKGFRPMELLAGSLSACTTIDVLNILNKQKIQPKKLEVITEAKRRENQVPSTFESIHLIFKCSDEVPQEKLERAITLSKEKYCSVSKILEPTCTITWELQSI
jgi:putative redox protein